jgi:HK97 family phage portal protein
VVLHRSPQPTISDTAGGIINLARTTFAAAIAADRYASRYWQAGGSPTTVLETEQRLTPTQTQETSELWAEKRSRGPDYAPVLSGGLKARSFGADPTSESAVEARRELVADIGRYFGVPTRILNAPTGDSETYTSTPAANQDLVRYTLQNYIGAIEDGISDVLPPGRRMEINTRKLVQGTQYEQAQTYQLATGNQPWMTVEEVRDAIDLPPVENPADLAPRVVPVAGGRP